MPLKSTILALNPTSYWPLDDAPGSPFCADAMGLKNACLPASGVTLAAVPFGASSAPRTRGDQAPAGGALASAGRAKLRKAKMAADRPRRPS
jgi:hypothetical protein